MADNPPLRILIVEDSPITTKQLCELIRSTSIPVIISAAATQQDALGGVATAVPDGILLDLLLLPMPRPLLTSTITTFEKRS